MAQTKNKSGFLASVREFVVLLIIVFLIRTFGFGLYQVPTGSMETTMLVGERFFADKLSYVFRNPVHNEIIAFNDPLYPYSNNWFMNLFQNYVWGPANWTKRVIGCPGDTVRGVIEDGKPVIYLKKAGTSQEVKLNEPYLNKYPLIRVWKDDPNEIRESIEQELMASVQSGIANSALINRIIEQRLISQTVPKSYDPSVPFAQQPFYRIEEERIFRYGPHAEMEIYQPGVPMSGSGHKVNQNGKNHWNSSDEFYVELGPDEFWCMGDNRAGSKDCRVFGPIKRSLIHARIVFRIWSIDSDASWWILDLLRHPVDFFSRVRWNRFFQRVH